MKIVLFEETRTEAFLALVAVPHKRLAISLEYVSGEFCKSRRTCVYFLFRNTSDVPLFHRASRLSDYFVAPQFRFNLNSVSQTVFR